MWISFLRGRWAIGTNDAELSFLKSFLIQPLSGISHQRNIVTLTVHRISQFLLIWCFLISEIVETPWLSKVLALPGLLPCRLPAPSVLGDFHKLVRDWVLSKPFLYNSDRLLVIHSNIVFLNPRGWCIPPVTFYKIWLYRVFSRVDCLALSELGCFAQMRVEFEFEKRVLLQSWSGVGHQSNILALTVHWVFPSSCYMLFCNPRSEALLDFLKILAVPSLVLCVLPCPVRVGWFAQKCLVMTFAKWYLIQLLSGIRHQLNIFLPLGLPSFPLNAIF